MKEGFNFSEAHIQKLIAAHELLIDRYSKTLAIPRDVSLDEIKAEIAKYSAACPLCAVTGWCDDFIRGCSYRAVLGTHCAKVWLPIQGYLPSYWIMVYGKNEDLQDRILFHQAMILALNGDENPIQQLIQKLNIKTQQL